MQTFWIADSNGNDALPLEHKLKYRYPRGYANVSDFVNNALSLRLVREHEGRLEKETFRFLGVNGSPFGDDGRDLTLHCCHLPLTL
jgi:hypothetical protein